MGKVTVINRFIYPLLWYPGTVLAAPEGVLVRLERAVFKFLWSGKTELVRRKVVYQDLRHGGLGLVHFPSKLRFLLTNNSVPHSGRPSGTYGHMRDTLRMMSTVGDVLQSSAGDLYQAIFDGLAGRVQPSHYALGPEVWRVVHSSAFGGVLEMAFAPALGAQSGRVCHMFWHCGFVALLWEWFHRLADRLTFRNTWAVSQDYALYGLLPPPGNTTFEKRVISLLTEIKADVGHNTALLKTITDAIILPESEEDEWISNFPLHSLDDVTAAEDKLENDAAARKKLVKKMSMIGGSTLDSTVRRILTFLIGSSLATKFNWLGRGHADKKAFSNLLLKDLIFRAISRNPLTKTATLSQVEAIIKMWLKHAADRNGSRKAQNPQTQSES
ncbi:hypothetical protein HOLleu_13730 [Holothuria leucospilota]|uniref:DUF4806 domain-containing protein n=1 Tax=Holothuria leucospilota TaxID=206669 RepID=A0A9Q1HBS2_HOLLE|nr:hypothetical protein HOLleu_13730 [Holothuria leucospilota]